MDDDKTNSLLLTVQNKNRGNKKYVKLKTMSCQSYRKPSNRASSIYLVPNNSTVSLKSRHAKRNAERATLFRQLFLSADATDFNGTDRFLFHINETTRQLQMDRPRLRNTTKSDDYDDTGTRVSSKRNKRIYVAGTSGSRSTRVSEDKDSRSDVRVIKRSYIRKRRLAPAATSDATAECAAVFSSSAVGSRDGRTCSTSSYEITYGNVAYTKKVFRRTNSTNPINASRKKSIRIFKATLNTRTLKTQGRLSELEYALDKINWNIIGLSEVKRSGEQIKEYNKNDRRCQKSKKELQEYTNWIPEMKQTKDSKKKTKRSEILEIATKFYQNLYNDETPSTSELCMEGDKEEIPLIIESEIIKAIHSQKMKKIPGDDGISNELLKGTVDATIKTLVYLFNEILRQETIPTQWSTSTIILLLKKGKLNDINNYRRISLMSNLYKIFSKIILDRMINILDENQPKEQAGFRSGFSTIDHIFTIKQITKNTKNTDYPTTKPL
ncbi:Probable RNA-directed DNA polymerase from transposon X-element [Eumeta japonica]|uniref:Probable RNA-directed DNA polymerase from transposon X-element n=1 Tax=Eumeta variegata TaxID=151549 RepID=A0A4C1VL67_EUMVA|nr:Probable RNA-directed DNA polymerase from transposon X-element [Eumeta japonica]